MEAVKGAAAYWEWRKTHPRIAGGDPAEKPKTREELKARNNEIRTRLQAMTSDSQGRMFRDDETEEWNRISVELTENDQVITQMTQREEWIAKVGLDGDSHEPAFNVRPAVSRDAREDPFDLTTIRGSFNDPDAQILEARDRAKRVIEGFTFPHEDVARGIVTEGQVKQHLRSLLETTEGEAEQGGASLHLLRYGSEVYKRAFGKMLLGRATTPEEERALSVGTGSAGGYAVPITLDPTLIPTSNGVVNPLRKIARIETIVGLEYRGLTAGAITASYAPEGTEASDNSPTLAQPDVFAERAQAFVPYSIEIGMDWNGLLAGMAKLLSDAKDVLEGTKFTLGAGHVSSEPSGFITGATNSTSTASSAAFAIADLYALEEALPPRFRPLAQFFGSRHVYNLIRQFGQNANQNLWMAIANSDGSSLSQGLANEPFQLGGNLGQRLLGYGTNEVSDMATTLTTGSKILAIGDPNYYLIVDRIGMTIETIPHLFGTNRRPTGQRGLYAYWRNTGTVVDAAAWRVLVTS